MTLARAGAGSQRIEDEIAAAVGAAAGLPARRRQHGRGRRPPRDPAPPSRRRPSGVLVGTQMVAKGHDFHDVVLGVVIDADSTLRFPDLRAEERTFALVAQLAGRSGRGERGGRVLVQTLTPEAEAIARAARHDAAGFLAGELERRRELGYPPFAHLIRIELSAPDAGRLEARGRQRCAAALDAGAAGGRGRARPGAALPPPRPRAPPAPDQGARARAGRSPSIREAVARRGPRAAPARDPDRGRRRRAVAARIELARSMSEVTEEQLERDLRGRATPEQDGELTERRARAPGARRSPRWSPSATRCCARAPPR